MILENLSAQEILTLVRNELIAQRALQVHLIDVIEQLGGPDRATVADQLGGLQLTFVNADGSQSIDQGAMEHLEGIAVLLRRSARENDLLAKAMPGSGEH